MFNAILVTETGAHRTALDEAFFEPDQPEQSRVSVSISYSSLNYKDALAIRGDRGVARRLPLIPGIDVCGRVESSTDTRFTPGDIIVLNGDGLGETRNGGLSEYAVIDGTNAVIVPEGLTERQVAGIGTAGLTAMLAVIRLSHGRIQPDSGPIVVTGATGGVGSFAVWLLNNLGYSVTAVTGRIDEYGEYLSALGASAILPRAQLEEHSKPLEHGRWAGAVDTVGGRILAHVLAQMQYGGTATVCGLASEASLNTTVMPLILRGVDIAGINSVYAPRTLRDRAWDALAKTVTPELFDLVTSSVTLDGAIGASRQMLSGERFGRTIVSMH